MIEKPVAAAATAHADPIVAAVAAEQEQDARSAHRPRRRVLLGVKAAPVAHQAGIDFARQMTAAGISGMESQFTARITASTSATSERRGEHRWSPRSAAVEITTMAASTARRKVDVGLGGPERDEDAPGQQRHSGTGKARSERQAQRARRRNQGGEEDGR